MKHPRFAGLPARYRRWRQLQRWRRLALQLPLRLRRLVADRGTRSPALFTSALGMLLLAALVAQLDLRDLDETSSLRAPSADRVRRAFSADSWWNTPLPDRTPVHPHEEAILEYLRTGPDSGDGCLMLAGTGQNPWGIPKYWAAPSDPEYDVRSSEHELPPELTELRIPVGAHPAANSDGNMTVYDLEKGYVVAMTHAEYDGANDEWSASGATVTYLDSNGLHVNTGRADDARNTGSHRGNNGATMAVSWDQVQNGAVRHILKIAAGPPVANKHIFPMVGSDGDKGELGPAIPPQGTRLRIKASVDLRRLGLDPDALVIARALQRYGVYIGDSGGQTSLKLEDTKTEGRGQLWSLEPDALCGLRFEPRFWDVVAESYDPTRPGGVVDDAGPVLANPVGRASMVEPEPGLLGAARP